MSNALSPTILIDWRYRVATTITEDYIDASSGVVYPAGSFVTTDTYVKHGNRRARLGDPSAAALFLNSSHRAYQQAIAQHPFLATDWPPKDGTDPSVRIYDYLEEVIASIVFAYTALESFANEMIPEEFIYEFQETTDSGLGVVHHYDKEMIERNLSLTDKMTTVLPRVTKKQSPKGLKVWEDFVVLRRLRNRIVHLKSSDRSRSKAHDLYPDSIWSELLNPKQPNYPSTAKDMILYFKDFETTHWLKHCPF